MLRTHFLQQWFSRSDPAMEEAFFDAPLTASFPSSTRMGTCLTRSTILRFRRRLN